MSPQTCKSARKEKRKRGDNWLEDDKNLLQELIQRNVSCIENKNTDTNTNWKKQNAWSEVAQSFNQICIGAQRTVDQLKGQWSTIKGQSRKTDSKRRKESEATGGGPPPQDEALCESDISVNEFITDAANVEFSDYEVESYADTKQNVETFNDERPENELLEVELPVENVKDHTENFNSKKRKKISKCQQPKYDAKIKEIADVDIKCRLELHKIQVQKEKLIIENERKRSKILDLKYDLLKARLIKEVGVIHL